MRDSEKNLSSSEARSQASLLTYNITELIKIFRFFRQQKYLIPPSCAVEIQHICMHMAALTEESIAKNLAASHFQSAIGHSKRALLDAYKELLFLWKNANQLSLEQLNKFANCRIGELKEGFTQDYRNTIAKYIDLSSCIINMSTPIQIVKSTKPDFDSSYWQRVKIWLELDALLSVLNKHSTKSASFLQQLIESFIFDERVLNKSRSTYLDEAIIQQKFRIVVILFSTKGLFTDFLNRNIDSKEIINTINDELSMLAKNPTTNINKYKKICSEVFPIISRYFKLNYATS